MRVLNGHSAKAAFFLLALIWTALSRGTAFQGVEKCSLIQDLELKTLLCSSHRGDIRPVWARGHPYQISTDRHFRSNRGRKVDYIGYPKFHPFETAPDASSIKLLPTNPSPPLRLVRAAARFQRCSPIKTRRVALGLKRVNGIISQLSLLRWSHRKPARILLKLLKSALANARQIYPNELIEPRIHSLLVLRGPYRKRMRFGSRGKLKMWQRPCSHIYITLQV